MLQHTPQSIDEMKARIRAMKTNKGRANIEKAVAKARKKMEPRQLQPDPDPVPKKTAAEKQQERETIRQAHTKHFWKMSAYRYLDERTRKAKMRRHPPKPVAPIVPTLTFPQFGENPVDNVEVITWNPPTLKEIARAVCALHHVTMTEMTGQQRNNRVVAARHHAFYLARKYTEHSLPTIGRAFGKRDHTTILHGIRKFIERRDEKKRTIII